MSHTQDMDGYPSAYDSDGSIEGGVGVHNDDEILECMHIVDDIYAGGLGVIDDKAIDLHRVIRTSYLSLFLADEVSEEDVALFSSMSVNAMAKFILSDAEYEDEEDRVRANWLLRTILILCLHTMKTKGDDIDAVKDAVNTLQCIIGDVSSTFFLSSVHSEENNTFAASIKLYDWVDAIYIQTTYPSERKWLRGRVTEINEPYIKVQYEKKGGGRDGEALYHMYSNKIARVNSKSIDREPPFDFLLSLKTGDICDVQDRLGNWYNATILNITNGRDYKYARVGFRIYSPFGRCVDSEGKSYGGWPEKDDETILLGPKFQPVNSRALDNTGLLSIIQDEDDEDECVAVIRPGHAVEVYASSMLVDNIIYLHHIDAFECILQLIATTSDPDIMEGKDFNLSML